MTKTKLVAQRNLNISPHTLTTPLKPRPDLSPPPNKPSSEINKSKGTGISGKGDIHRKSIENNRSKNTLTSHSGISLCLASQPCLALQNKSAAIASRVGAIEQCRRENYYADEEEENRQGFKGN